MATRNISHRLLTSNVTRVLIKEFGWVTIKPGSFQYASANFYYPLEEDQEEENFSGLSLMTYRFIDNATDTVYCIPTDALAGIEMNGAS